MWTLLVGWVLRVRGWGLAGVIEYARSWMQRGAMACPAGAEISDATQVVASQCLIDIVVMQVEAVDSLGASIELFRHRQLPENRRR